MRILSGEAEIGRVQKEFERIVSLAGGIPVQTSIGHPNGHLDTRVLWIPSINTWAYFGLPPDEKSSGERYWNVFGIGEPGASVSIVCEINPPIRGIDRRPSGAFAESSGGDISVIHRGLFNAFRGRIPKDFTRHNFNGTWISVNDGDVITDVLRVGALSDTNFVHDLRAFVIEADRLKEVYKTKTSSDPMVLNSEPTAETRKRGYRQDH